MERENNTLTLLSTALTYICPWLKTTLCNILKGDNRSRLEGSSEVEITSVLVSSV